MQPKQCLINLIINTAFCLPDYKIGIMDGMRLILQQFAQKTGNNFFGEIIDGKMQLSEIGLLATKYWREISEHFPFVKLNEFIVMPNHVHGIIVIDKPDDGCCEGYYYGRNIETQDFASLREQSKQKNKFGPQF